MARDKLPIEMISKVRKAIQDPSKVPPYLHRQFNRVVQGGQAGVRRLATQIELVGTDSQYELIDGMRRTDSWLLVVLDACRYEQFSRVAPKVFEGSIKMAATEAHDTFGYVRSCWDGEYPDVTYVSGAVPINSVRLDFDDEHLSSLYEGYHPADHLGTIIDVWKSHWDSRLGTTPAWHVTDEATRYLDEPNLVVHYFQPHAPYIGSEQALGHTNDESAMPGQGEPIDAPLWRRIKQGEITRPRLFELYRSNLELAVTEAAKLVQKAPHDRIVVTSDHGEALGEYGTFGHPRVDHPYIRTIPWMEITGLKDGWRDTFETPDPTEPTTESDGATVEKRLEDLGYI